MSKGRRRRRRRRRRGVKVFATTSRTMKKR